MFTTVYDHWPQFLRGCRRSIIRGGGLIFIYLCSVSLISFEIDCFYSLWTQMYEYQLPPIINFLLPLQFMYYKHLCKALKFHHLFYLLDIYIAFHGFPFHKAFLRGVYFASRKSFFLVLGNYIHFAEDPPSLKHTSLIIVVETCTNLTVKQPWLTVYIVWHDPLTFWSDHFILKHFLVPYVEW